MHDSTPKLGIYWWHKGRFVLTLDTPLQDIPVVGDFIDIETGHEQYWLYARDRLHGLAHKEYDEVPRGRIIYSTPDGVYRVYGPGKLMRSKRFRQSVIKKFQLPWLSVKFYSDDHYEDPLTIQWD
jgi:hypothetical protein